MLKTTVIHIFTLLKHSLSFSVPREKREGKTVYKEIQKGRKNAFSGFLCTPKQPSKLKDWKHYKKYLNCHTGRLFPAEKNKFEKDALAFWIIVCMFAHVYTHALPHLLKLLQLKIQLHHSALHFHLQLQKQGQPVMSF